MNQPNFFIIGAPKCGTTALAMWLRAHPQIFIPAFKEPHFFNDDHTFLNTPDWKHYNSLFEPARPQHTAIGEASVWYLYSTRAVPRILKHFPNAQFIVQLRNPVDMAYSLHEQQCYSGQEHIKDFRKAWGYQEKRRLGKKISFFCREPKHILYAEACRLGAQLERLYQNAPASQVLPLLLDDLKQDPGREYRRVLDFLGVEDDGRQEFPVINGAKQERIPGVSHCIRAAYALKRKCGSWNKGFGIVSRINALNTRFRPRPKLPPDLRSEILAWFAHDITLLEELLDRDLSHWQK